jgi:hypothetical protein
MQSPRGVAFSYERGTPLKQLSLGEVIYVDIRKLSSSPEAGPSEGPSPQVMALHRVPHLQETTSS